MNRHSANSPVILKPVSLNAALAWFLTVSVILTSGCSPNDDDFEYGLYDGQQNIRSKDDVSQAMGFVNQLDQLDRQQASERIISHLNRWIEKQGADPQWLADPLISRLPTGFPKLVPYIQLADRRFTVDDVEFLEETVWLSDIARWAPERLRDEEFSRFLDQVPSISLDSETDNLESAIFKLHEGLSQSQASDLTIALRLFDWTIRNTQLEALLPPPLESVGPQSQPGAAATGVPAPPPLLAIPGPGYTRLPWQTLLHGSGDSWQRARVFIHLARQRYIDVVMLATSSATGPKPWLPAVVIGERLYLFDTALGLPLPGPDGKGIATLEQVVTDPKLLRSLDIAAQEGEPKYRYSISAEDLKQIIVLIDASPAYLSQRMKMLQSRLSAADKIVLATSPSTLAAKIRKHPSVQSVRLWAVPTEAILYRFARVQKLQRLNLSDQKERQLFLDTWLGEVVFSQNSPIGRGRRQHFRGVFETPLDEAGAKSWYLSARMSDDEIQAIASNPALQQRTGLLAMLPDEPQARAVALENSVKFFVKTNQSAGYWLALAHYDNGDYPNAVNWLLRTLEAGEDGTWSPGASYNLGRLYESIGKSDKAKAFYLQDHSPQRHGSLIRAGWLDHISSQ